MEQFLRTFSGRRVADIGRDEIAGYLNDICSDPKAKDWLVRQKVDALRLLLVDLAGSPEARQVDWGYWAETRGAALSEVHPTLARELPPELVLRRVSRSANIDADAQEALGTMIRILRTERYSIRTENAYRDWAHRLLAWAGKPVTSLDSGDVAGFLSYLAVEKRVGQSTQRQALNGISFFFRHVLNRPLELGDGFRPAKRSRRLPTVLSREEVGHLLEAGYGIRTVQTLLGHADVSTTMIYTHVMNRPGLPPAVSPADF